MNIRKVILAAGCLAVALSPLAPADSAAPEDSIQSPTSGKGPTTVYIAMGLLDIDEIDSANQSFAANLFYETRWGDPRLAHEGPGHRTVGLNDIWHPQLFFVNQQKVFTTFPEVAHVSPDGDVLYRQRVWGPFSQPLDVRQFPFDTQDFEMRLACADAGPEEVRFKEDPDSTSGLAHGFSLPDWAVLAWNLDFAAYQPLAHGSSYASFALVFHARRYWKPFMAKVVLPLVLVVAMSWLVFWINPQEAGTQIGVATTSMLTLIAYRFMVGGTLPPVPYFTRVDYFILGSTVLVFLALLEAIATAFMTAQGGADRALRIDLVCRFLFPAVFVALLVMSFLL